MSLVIKKLKQIYLGYKHMIQLCVVIFVLSLLTMFDGKSLIDFTSLFSPHDFKKNDQIIKRIFKNE